jgi:Protein of unknown function (DUF1761)
MTLMNVNLWSVLVAAIATMVVGFLWYSPMLFARPWGGHGLRSGRQGKNSRDAKERR